MKLDELEAYSTDTGVTYVNWSALVAAETNGTIVTVVITNTRKNKSWPWSSGPFDSVKDARNYVRRMRRKFIKEQKDYPHLSFTFHIKELWKTPEQLAELRGR